MSTTSNTEKTPSPWIVFNGTIRRVLTASGAEKPAVMQFASFLKAKNAAYDAWTEAQILTEFGTWVPPPPKEKEPKEKKSKKEPKEGAEKRAPTPWLLFLGRVRTALNTAAAGSDDPLFQELSSKVMQFASALKAKSAAYDAWTDAKIVKEFRGWVPPPKEPKAPKAAKSDSGSEGKKERKKPAPKSPEEQAAINAKRAATREANKAAKAASSGESAAESGAEEAKPAWVRAAEAAITAAAAAKAASSGESAGESGAEEAKPASVSGSEGKKERKKPAPKTAEEKAAINAKRAATREANKAASAAAPAFTLEQLRNWQPVDDTEYGMNERGDVIDEERNFVGRMKPDGKTIDRKFARPADWEQIVPTDDE
jgi:hypothetical protein